MAATADAELAYAGPGALAARVQAGEIAPRELVELCLRRIEQLDPRLNAFRVTVAEPALAEADALAGRDDLASLPLAGVPFAVKDDLPLAGQPTTRGSRSFGPPAHADAEVVRRLRAAGAIPVGVTNVPELMIFPWTATEANGITRNPWNPERTPGGSSGGSAAAVAAGLVPFATASDGGGSIRIPAACCGLVGMKPSRGRVSTQPFAEPWLDLSVFGALARTVADSALLLDVLHGATAADRHRLDPPAEPYRELAGRDPGRLRIAVTRRIPSGLIAKLSDDQGGAFARTCELLAGLGHEIIERDPDYALTDGLDFTQTWLRGVSEDAQTVPDRSRLEPSSRQMATLGRLLVPPWRRAALLRKRTATTARLTALFDSGIDVLLTPGLARTPIAAEGGFGKAFPLAFNVAASFTPWTAMFNLTGQPAVTVPAGFAADGLPLSVQLAGQVGDEATLYQLAGQLERAAPWADHRPPLAA